MILAPPMASRELEGTPDLVELVGAARDAGHEVALIERPMPDAISVAGIGRLYDLVSTSQGAALEDAAGRRLDEEADPDPLLAGARLWRRLAAAQGGGAPGLPGTRLVALGGFAFDVGREPRGSWSGFSALLFRVPALAVTRVRGRTFVSGDERLLDQPAAHRGPRASHLRVEPVRPPERWGGAVAEAARRLRAGEAAKVVLAREVMARADGVLAASAVARALRTAYPACFTYLVAGADGTAFTGASPELLVRRSGSLATCQPMAGSVARGEDEASDRVLAAGLLASAKETAEHRVVAQQVAAALAPFSERVVPGAPEVVRLANIQHLATTVQARLRRPPAGLLELAAALHPTAAVSGAPDRAARLLIAELEGMERGWYGGGVGWLDGRGDGELAVAVRGGLLWEDGARIYAGGGIMPDSDPDSELAETELKLRALLGALAG